VSTDHSLVLKRILREALKNQNLSKQDFETDELKHSFSVNYSRARQVFNIAGTMYCSELWLLLKRSLSQDLPVYDYAVGAVIGIWPFSFDLEGGLDEPFILNHVEEIVSLGIVPILKAVRTPVDAVKYAMDHRGVLASSGVASDRDLGRWASHYKIPFTPQRLDEDDLW